MIRRETLKLAIDAISERTPEIGYTLDEMLGRGTIDAPDPGGDTMLGDDFFFFFDHHPTRVSKFLYIHKGTVPIEERLLVKYGELLKKRELLERGEAIDTDAAAATIRLAGLRFMVLHEIDFAIARIQNKGEACAAALIASLEALKREVEPPVVSFKGSDNGVLYHGIVGVSTPAVFLRFPFCMESLLQAADINLEFFHVRFFLNRLIKQQIQNCCVCLVNNRIVGIIYVIFKEQMLFRNLVIDCIATTRGKREPGSHAPRGVGAFMVAGLWLGWKSGLWRARNITLDSEVEARGFYETLGFQSRGFAEYVLGAPGPHLLKSIVSMQPTHGKLRASLMQEIGKRIASQVKSLRKKPKTERDVSSREAMLETLRTFLNADKYAGVIDDTVRLLLKYQKKIPESEELLRGVL